MPISQEQFTPVVIEAVRVHSYARRQNRFSNKITLFCYPLHRRIIPVVTIANIQTQVCRQSSFLTVSWENPASASSLRADEKAHG